MFVIKSVSSATVNFAKNYIEILEKYSIKVTLTTSYRR